jgi:hypothetical protein
MNSTAIAAVSVACIFGGTLVGLVLRRIVPADHLDADSKDAVKVGAGMISMMSALVLGLLVSSAKNTFDSTNAAIVQSGAKVILLDRVLAAYGPEVKELRDQLRLGLAASIELLWPEEGVHESLSKFEKAAMMEKLGQRIRALKPESDAQRRLQEQALGICNEILLSRWVQIEQAQIPLPTPFLVILLFWLTLLYTSFGLLAPHNGTVITAMFVGALALATALFLILEMNRPMAGTIKASSAPMRKALEHLGR